MIRPKVILIVILALGCGRACERSDLVPTDQEFDKHVETMIANFGEVEERFFKLRVEYNEHLGASFSVVPFLARCNREFLTSEIDTILSGIERLDVLDEKIDALVDCAWDFEQSFSLHYNNFHGEWHCEWAKFYSPVPDSLRNTPATYIRCVEENLAGVTGFIYALRLDFDEHLESYH